MTFVLVRLVARLGRCAGCPFSLFSSREDSSMPARLLSVPAVAAALDVDRRTVYRFIAAGELPVVDLRTGTGRSRVRVPVGGLEEFIASRSVVSPRNRR
ncbi:helix-turn-helix domain-containing protein [Streptomyces achromogenes]